MAFAIGAHEATRPLVIDPVLGYSTYLGGSANDGIGVHMTIDSTGAVYFTGYTPSTNFPTQNPQQAAKVGFDDAFVAKLSPTGALVYSTYLGGGDEDFGSSVAVAARGNAYVIGSTSSLNFPTQSPFQSTNHGGGDAFISKLSPTGSGARVFDLPRRQRH